MCSLFLLIVDIGRVALGTLWVRPPANMRGRVGSLLKYIENKLDSDEITVSLFNMNNYR